MSARPWRLRGPITLLRESRRARWLFAVGCLVTPLARASRGLVTVRRIYCEPDLRSQINVVILHAQRIGRQDLVERMLMRIGKPRRVTVPVINWRELTGHWTFAVTDRSQVLLQCVLYDYPAELRQVRHYSVTALPEKRALADELLEMLRESVK
jgi:hypothetical protein